MRLLGILLAHASTLFNGRSGGNTMKSIVFCNALGRQDARVLKNAVTSTHMNSYSSSTSGFTEGTDGATILPGIPNELKLKYENIYSNSKDDYIKSLELENEKLSMELSNQRNIVQSLITDLRRIDCSRRSCMIYELYQRFRTIIAKDLEEQGVLKDGKKLEAYLDEIRRGKAFPDTKILYWMVKFDVSPEALALKTFRNDFAHHTIDDLTTLRLWRTELLQETNPPHDRQINSALIEILTKVINYLSGPESKPLQSKYHQQAESKAAATASKKEKESEDSEDLMYRDVLGMSKKRRLSKK